MDDAGGAGREGGLGPSSGPFRYHCDVKTRVVPDGAHPRIVRQPGVHGGEPVIRGSRVTVRDAVELTRAGESVEEIGVAFPHITTAEIGAALAFYADNRDEIDHSIEEGKRISKDLLARSRKIAPGVFILDPPDGA